MKKGRTSFVRTKQAALLFGFLLAVMVSLGWRFMGGPPTILFLGDSNTESRWFAEELHAIFTERVGEASPRLILRGRGGETLSGLSEAQFPGDRPDVFQRLSRELRRWRPTWVVGWYGMNDGLFQPFDQERFLMFQDGLNRFADTILASGAQLILLTPPLFARPGRDMPNDPQSRRRQVETDHSHARTKLAAEPARYGYFSPYMYYDDVLTIYADWMKEMGEREKVWVLDIRTPLMENLDKAYDLEDRVHPNRVGHRIIAETFLNAWKEISDGR
ncbi:MAG TPA: GDSL-type esterase/lipase family protein [Kiritimatiellia bacterium]|nr:GDSL-type esterase/lipase family protein [Kiritimatiellia bacterium]